MARKRAGNEARTEKIMFTIEPQILSDYKALAALDDKSMTDKICGYITQEIASRQAELKAFRAIQAGNV